VELLALPAGKSCYILEIGCGSGLSGLALEKAGHHWVGCDISPSMLEVARRRTGENEKEDEEEEEDEEDEEDEDDEDAEDEEYEEEEEAEEQEEDPNATSSGDLLRVDMGQGLPFRPASFDGAVSVSALQWLCYSDASDQDPKLRLNRFFSTLYSVLKRDAKAILQFYPENGEQAHLIAQAASKVGFAGGQLEDYPN
jgi:18S rRNA (guanine1575-N7)-methyltransferase